MAARIRSKDGRFMSIEESNQAAALLDKKRKADIEFRRAFGLETVDYVPGANCPVSFKKGS